MSLHASPPLPPSSILTRLGWDENFATSFLPYLADCVPGRVSRVDRGAADVLTATGPLRVAYAAGLVSGAVRDPVRLPTVGDWVAVSLSGSGAPPLLTAVLPRRTAFVRGTPGGATEGQVLAANADLVLIVHALAAAARLGRIERFLALAWESGARPVLVLTKADLLDDPESATASLASSAPGVDVVAVSAVTGAGVEEVATHLGPGRTAALLGPSGVGKSTLVNALMGRDVMDTGAVRADGRGRHTTVHRELLELPAGGVLIDTPGLRGLALWNAEEGVERAFADVEDYAVACRFADCRHEGEPGCAVLAAVAGGALPQRRVDSYRKLQRELSWLEVRQDARLRAERSKQWRVQARATRGRVRP